MQTSVDQIVVGTANLLAESMRKGCKLFLFCSSVSVYGDILISESDTKSTKKRISEDVWPKPFSYYGCSKLSAEALLRICAESSSMKGVCLRLAGTHGPGRKNGVFYNMVTNALRGKPLRVEEPRSRFRLLFLDDAIQAMVACLQAPTKENYRCYNVASKDVFTLSELAKQIITYTGSKSSLDIHDRGRVRNQVWSIDRICKETEFRPKSLEKHISMMHEYIRMSERN
jgi:nucleoside-diphosphate-sugar epimerase